MMIIAIIIVTLAAALTVAATFAIVHYTRYAAKRLVHVREMAKLRETSDENAHRRYMEIRKLEDQLARPADQQKLLLEAAFAEAQAEAATATKALESYRESRLHSRY